MERVMGYQVEARRRLDPHVDTIRQWAEGVTVVDMFALREAAIQCARLLVAAGIEVVGVWEVRDYSEHAPSLPDATDRIPIDWMAE